jgi:hypothetical protein
VKILYPFPLMYYPSVLKILYPFPLMYYPSVLKLNGEI